MQTFFKLPSKTKQQHLGGLRAGTLAEPRMQMPTHGPLARHLNKNPPTTPDVHHRLSWPPRNIPRSCQDNSFGGTLCQHVTSVHANDYKCSFKVTWICVHVCARVCMQCVVGLLVCVQKGTGGLALKPLISNRPPFNLT